MPLLTPEQDRLLTDDGFIERFEQYWFQGMTQLKAWERANDDVKGIRGRGRYDDDKFDVFIAVYKQRRARLKKKRARLADGPV